MTQVSVALHSRDVFSTILQVLVLFQPNSQGVHKKKKTYTLNEIKEKYYIIEQLLYYLRNKYIVYTVRSESHCALRLRYVDSEARLPRSVEPKLQNGKNTVKTQVRGQK